MKVGIRTGFVIVAALLQVSIAQSVPEVTPFSADVSVTSGRDTTRDMTGKMYVSRENMRMDIISGPHGSATIITNFATRTTDTLMPEQHMYLEFNAEQAIAQHPGMAAYIKPFLDPYNPCAKDEDVSCTNLGVEGVNRRSCDHWQITHNNGNVSNTWIDRTLHFPIKTVSGETTWQLTNIKEGDQPAGVFAIPSGYQKMDLGQMMQGMREQQ